MIPKIVHYCWFSGDPYPDVVQKCMDSWSNKLPDYEFRLWDMDAIKNIDSVFLKEALQEQVWAYASDYVRLYALYYYGGIYLDTDVLILKPFGNLLRNRAFIGKEYYTHFRFAGSEKHLTSHCMGAEPKHPFIGDCLEYYNNRHFIQSNNMKLPPQLRRNYVLLPYIQAEIARLYGYKWNALVNGIQHCDEGLDIYPEDYFDQIGRETANARCRHMALGSWDYECRDRKYPLSYKIKWRMMIPVQWLLRKLGYAIKEL